MKYAHVSFSETYSFKARGDEYKLEKGEKYIIVPAKLRRMERNGYEVEEKEYFESDEEYTFAAQKNDEESGFETEEWLDDRTVPEVEDDISAIDSAERLKKIHKQADRKGVLEAAEDRKAELK